MGKGKKKIARQINGQTKIIESQEAQPQPTKTIEIEVKPDPQTSQSLSNGAKVEVHPAETIVQHREGQTEVRVEPQKGDQLPLQSKIEYIPSQVAHQNPISNHNQSQIGINGVKPQRGAQQTLTAQNQPTQRRVEKYDQHIGQPLQVIPERSAEQLSSNGSSYQFVNNLQVENPIQVVIQPQAQHQMTENSNLNLPQVPSRQVVDSLPVDSQHHEQIQLQNQCIEYIPQTADEMQAEIPAQLKLNDSVASKDVMNSESFVSIEGEQERRQREQFLLANYHAAQIAGQREAKSFRGYTQDKRSKKQVSSDIHQNVDLTEQQQLQDQKVAQVQSEKAAQIQSERVTQVQSERTQANHEQNQNADAQKVTEKTEQRVEPSITSETAPERSDAVPQIPVEPAHDQTEIINLHNSAENIQVLQHSNEHQAQIYRQKLQSQSFSESICISESVEVSKLQQNQQQQHYNPKQVQLEVKPEVVQVHQSSNNLLDINQAIEIVSSVQQNPQVVLANNSIQQQIQQRRDEGSRIFTLVQSEEIAADEAVKIDDSADFVPKQINVKQSLSFSDLNYSAQRSVGKEQQASVIHQSIKQSQPQPQNGQLKAGVIVQTIQEVVENKQIQASQQPIQAVNMPMEILVQQKVEVVQTFVQENVRTASQLLPRQAQIQAEVPVSKQSQSNLSQREELSTSNREAIIEQAKLIEQLKSFQRKGSEIVLQVESKVQPKQPSKKDQDTGPSMMSKLMISSASFAIVGGIGWAFTKSMEKSLVLGAVVSGVAFAALNLLAN